MKTSTRQLAFSRELIDLLLFGVFFVALPHAFNLHAGILAFFSLCVTWRFAGNHRPTLRPQPAVLFVFTLVGGALVYVLYHRFYGRDPGAALFIVGLGLKLLEMKSKRDIFLVIYLAFFVALTQYLFSQSIPMAAYTLVAVTLLVAVLIGVSGGPSVNVKLSLKRSGAMVAQAIPLMVVLFLFFPRIQGPLWRLPDEADSRRTGLSDTIEPGSVSRLGHSFEPAFRVDFQGEAPPSSALYWRGPVFWRVDGNTWTLPRDKPLAENQKPEISGPGINYLITLEPHQRNWVFALDLPDQFPPELTQTADYRLISKSTIQDRRQYRLTSHIHYRTGDLSADERRLGLQLPFTEIPRIAQLVASWTATSPDDPAQVINAALRYFREQPFVYTLNPPLLSKNPVETFLFETRRGFCEHYATAFVILMRKAGIPARVVTGYQGGQWNPLGSFLEVRQADAHAWAEVWLAEKGWTRIDPTAAVAPERIEHGIDLDQQAAAGEVSFNGMAPELLAKTSGWHYWLRRGRMTWAGIDHAWNLWVLSYDPSTQKRFWESLGIVDWRTLGLWLLGFCFLGGCLAFYLLRPRRRGRPDPSLALYQTFLNRLARRGITPKTGEGPRDFGVRAAATRPEASDAIARITALFLGIRYGRHSGAAELAQLRQLVRAFRP